MLGAGQPLYRQPRAGGTRVGPGAVLPLSARSRTKVERPKVTAAVPARGPVPPPRPIGRSDRKTAGGGASWLRQAQGWGLGGGPRRCRSRGRQRPVPERAARGGGAAPRRGRGPAGRRGPVGPAAADWWRGRPPGGADWLRPPPGREAGRTVGRGRPLVAKGAGPGGAASRRGGGKGGARRRRSQGNGGGGAGGARRSPARAGGGGTGAGRAGAAAAAAAGPRAPVAARGGEAAMRARRRSPACPPRRPPRGP